MSVRVSTLDQKTDRQKVNENDFDTVIEDKCSGAPPFFERGGKHIEKFIKKAALESLAVWTVDRLGRDQRDIINTIYYFREKKIGIQFISQGLTTLEANGKENSISKMMISILGIVGEMERIQIKESQLEGIRIVKLKVVYKGRVIGSREGVLAFLSKKKNKEVYPS